jgi:multiple sugar transport system permease protein
MSSTRESALPPRGRPAAAGRRLLGVRRSELSTYLFCYLMLAPVLAVFAYLRFVPIVQTFVISFYKWDLTQPIKPFIGLDNYAGMLSDERFFTALRNTTVFSFATVLGSVALALPIAVLLAGRVRFTPLYQAIFFLPVITPMVPMSVAWKWIYDPTHGILNYLLSLVGVSPVGWLVYPETALWAIVGMSIWKVIGYNMVILLVGIKNIPAVYYEAARIDGAGGFALFRAITLPLLRPILLVVFVTSTINAYNVFTQVYVMTLGSQAAPGNALRVLVYEIYQNGFQFFRMGYASSEAVVLTVIVFALTLFQFWVMRRQQALA